MRTPLDDDRAFDQKILREAGQSLWDLDTPKIPILMLHPLPQNGARKRKRPAAEATGRFQIKNELAV